MKTPGRVIAAGAALWALLLIACLALLFPSSASWASAKSALSADNPQATPDFTVEKTVGLDATACATTSSIVVSANTTVYFCLKLVNNSNSITLTSAAFTDTLLGLNNIQIANPVAPGQQLTITNNVLTSTTAATSFVSRWYSDASTVELTMLGMEACVMAP